MKNYYFILALCSIHLIAFSQPSNHWIMQGNNSHKQGNLTEALESYDIHIAQYPNDALGYLYRGKLLTVLGDNRQGLADLNLANSLNPVSQVIFSPALRSKYAAKKSFDYDYSKSNEIFLKSPSHKDYYATVLTTIGKASVMTDDIRMILESINTFEIEDAERALNQIEVTDENKFLIYDLYGKLSLKRNQYLQAIEYFDLAIELVPGFSLSHHNRGISYLLLDNFRMANYNIDEALRLNNDIPLFYFTKAFLFEKQTDFENAKKYYQTAIELDQNYTEAIINYSQLLKAGGNYSDGMMLVTDINDFNNDYEKLYITANIDFINGRYLQAIQGYDQYLQKHPLDREAMYNKGLSLLLLDRNMEGCQCLKQTLFNYGNNHQRQVYDLFCNRG